MNKQKGISQVLIMVIMLVLAIALPVTTKLVQQSQENRSSATDTATCLSGQTRFMYNYTGCVSGNVSLCSGCILVTGGVYSCYDSLAGCTAAHPKVTATPTVSADCRSTGCSSGKTCTSDVGIWSCVVTTTDCRVTGCPSGSSCTSDVGIWDCVVTTTDCRVTGCPSGKTCTSDVGIWSCSAASTTVSCPAGCSANDGCRYHGAYTGSPDCAHPVSGTVNYTTVPESQCGKKYGAGGGTDSYCPATVSCPAGCSANDGCRYHGAYTGSPDCAHPVSGTVNYTTVPESQCGKKYGAGGGTDSYCPAACSPSCSCAANTLVGQTCSNGCGGTCSGTKTSTTYTCSAKACSSNYGCMRNGVFTSSDAACTTPIGTVSRTIDQACPKRNGAGGGNDDACITTTTCTESNWTSTLSPTTCPSTGKQTKTWTKAGTCTGGVTHPATETVTCTPGVVTCTDANWTSALSPTTCPSTGKQTKTWTKKGTCTGGVTHPATETVTCTPPVVACTDANWTSTVSPTTCPSTGQQTKTWTKVGTCTGGVTHPATEVVKCTPGSGDGMVNIKFAFAGVKSGKCAIDWPVTLKVVDGAGSNILDQVFRGNSTQTTATNNKGEIVYNFRATVSGVPAAGASNLAFLLTGPKHISLKYGQNNQTGWFSNLAGSLGLTTGVNSYDFSGFSLLAGDVTGDTSGTPDGKIDGRDYSYIKERANDLVAAVADGTNLTGDINGDCQVNSGDIDLIKSSLKEINGQTY